MTLPDDTHAETLMRELTTLSTSLLSALENAQTADAMALDTRRRDVAEQYVSATRNRTLSAGLQRAQQQLLTLDRQIIDAAMQQRSRLARQSSAAREGRTARQAYQRTLAIEVMPSAVNTRSGSPQ